jgi:hypothetical protein
MNIGNIHVMRDSLRKVQDVCATKLPRSEFHAEQDSQWVAVMDQSGWLSHLQRILSAAVRVVSYLSEGKHVLVHCTDG